MKTPFLGQAYVARSINFADNRLVNMYPEAAAGDAKEVGCFYRCPGLVLKTTLTGQTGSEVRGMWELGNYAYVVCGNGFFSIDSAFSATLIGTVSGSGPVSMADNGVQIFIACNPDGYIYNTSTQVFQQITDPDFLGAVTVGYLDGSFLYNVPDSEQFQWTAISDGTDIGALDFASAEGSPDQLVALYVDHLEAWMFGNSTIEVFGSTGDLDNPYQRIQGAIIEQGCAAPYSIARLDNSLFWLGRNKEGQGGVFRANGYTPVPISTPAIAYAIAQWPTLDDAIAYSYFQEGHGFYVLTSPSASETWVYDVSTGLWHQRAYLEPDTGDLVRHRGTSHVLFNGFHLIGDNGEGQTDGRVWAFSLDTYTDGSDAQKWLRSWRALPMGGNDLKRTSHHQLQIDCQSGTGLITGQGLNPAILLRWSDDGGHTWSNYKTTTMGQIGKTGTRVMFRRLGTTHKLRDRVYEVSGTDPVKIALTGALLDISKAAS